MTPRDLCGLALWVVCGLVALRAARRTLSPEQWGLTVAVLLVSALVLVAAYKDQIDAVTAHPFDVAGAP